MKRIDSALSRRSTTLLAVVGMTLVLVVLAGFGSWAASTTGANQRSVAASDRIRTDFQVAYVAAVKEQAIGHDYELFPDTSLRDQYTAQIAIYITALNDARPYANAAETARITELVAVHAELRNQFATLFAALDLGAQLTGETDNVEGRVDQLSTQVENGLADATASADKASRGSLTAMNNVDQVVSRTTPIVFGAGLGLMLIFGGIVVAYRRRVERQAAEADYTSLHDSLTGLPNRALFRDRGERALATTRRNNATGAVMMLDLDRFKDINDTLGHHHGDELLVQVAARIKGVLREADTVARLGGDEFTILLPEISNSDAATTVADKVAKTLEHSFVVEGVTIDLEASVGVSLFPEHGQDIDSLLHHADVAMYTAKRDHARVAVYSENLVQSSPMRLALLGELRRGLQRHELVVFYQPKVDMASKAVIGVEALLRWQHPELGLMPPGDFIPLVERTGLIHPLTNYVLSSALQQARDWALAGTPLAVAVNISARSLLNDDFPDVVGSLLEQFEVPAAMLELEITENTLMSDPGHARRALLKLRNMGVVLSIDDFGTGYSSLSYLNELPVQAVKIDRSFITELPQHAANRLIVTSIVGLGRDLGMKVIAEGVETPEAWAELAKLGCDEAQGYLLTRPMPVAEFEQWRLRWAADNSPVDRMLSIPA